VTAAGASWGKPDWSTYRIQFDLSAWISTEASREQVPQTRIPHKSLKPQGRSSLRRNLPHIEIVHAEPPPGQQFLLRRYLQEVLGRAPFEGESWDACIAAFLAAPGMPLLTQNGVSQAPASFFLNLYTTRDPTYAAEGDGLWGESDLPRRLADLGDHRLTMLIATDATRSWAIYLNESLDDVLGFHGRTLPGSRHTSEDDDADLLEPTLIRHLPVDVAGMQAVKLDLSRPRSPHLVLADPAGHGYEFRFAGCLRLRTSPPGNTQIGVIDEVRGPTGRTWFVFQPVDLTSSRKLAVQADRAEWIEILNAAEGAEQTTPG
jgi:hypothetical protein